MAWITNGNVLALALKRLYCINMFNGMDVKVVAKAKTIQSFRPRHKWRG